MSQNWQAKKCLIDQVEDIRNLYMNTDRHDIN